MCFQIAGGMNGAYHYSKVTKPQAVRTGARLLIVEPRRKLPHAIQDHLATVALAVLFVRTQHIFFIARIPRRPRRIRQPTVVFRLDEIVRLDTALIGERQHQSIDHRLPKQPHQIKHERVFPAVVGMEEADARVHAAHQNRHAHLTLQKRIAVIQQRIDRIFARVLRSAFPIRSISSTPNL